MSTRLPNLAFGIWAALSLAATVAEAVSVPPQFVVENAVPGIAFEIPTAIAFLPGGRMLVAEKRGRVWAVSNGIRNPTPLWEGENEVLNETDRGLLSIAVDPGYVTNHYIYLLYAVDPDSNGVDDNDEAFGRLARYTVSFADSNTVDYPSRTILLGTGWRDGPCVGAASHTIGDLQWGADGSLLVSTGDGAHHSQPDAGGLDPGMFAPGKVDPVEDIGAFRAQYIGSLAGKILRIDPADGRGYPSNPFWDGNGASVPSRVWCYGLRNPFRFEVRPGSGSTSPAAGDPGTLFVGDVGWYTWEEQNVTPEGGRNFGWPCHEGPLPQGGYQGANPIHHGCDSLGLGDNTGLLTAPVLSFHHTDASQSTPQGSLGNTAIGGAFYTAAIYPALYQGRYFFADYGREWINSADVDGSDAIVSISWFAVDAGGPVDLEADPVSGDLFYVAIITGEVRRIRWTGSVGANNPPVAVASRTTTSGRAPLTVAFSSAGTYDPDLDSLTLSWNFGDGVGSSLGSPDHTYLTGGVYPAVLTADDGAGGIGRDTVVVTVYGGAGPFPSTPVLDDFNRPDGVLGGSWAGEVTRAAISNNAASTTCCNIGPAWNGEIFGPDQEAYFTFSTVQPETQTLMLKVQGTNPENGYLEVRYDGSAGRILVSTYALAQGFTELGEFPIPMANGDQLGARAWSNGSVEIYKNGVRIGTASMGDWPFASLEGQVGFILESSFPARIDDFGGGDIVLNTAPSATILSPADSTFFIEGAVLSFWARARDVEELPDALASDWRMDLHHGNHVHPGSFVATGASASYTIPIHEDGTGVWYEIVLHVTDSGGLADTARASIFPEVDLAPGPVQVIPPYPGTTTPTEYRFRIHNHGRMMAPASRWRLVGDEVLLAEGDVQVPALDSIAVVVTVPPMMTAGDHTLRLVVDTLVAVVETQEENNAVNQPILVVSGPGTVGAPAEGPPRALALSSAYPSPSGGTVSLALELPRASRVGFSVHDLQGRRVWQQPERDYEAGRWVLGWDGGRTAGGRAPTGLYLARVTVDGHVLVRHIAWLR